MKRKYRLSLTLVSILFCSCNGGYAQDSCEPGYPDQFPFDACGEVVALEWDTGNSVDELAPNSNGTVSVLHGNAPYTWTISGNGFYLDQAGSIQKIVSSSSSITIYSFDTCGTGVITATDGCTTVVGHIRSDSGHWELQDYDFAAS